MIFWVLFMVGIIVVPVHYEQKIDTTGEKLLTIATFSWSYTASSCPNGYRHHVLDIRVLLIWQLLSKWKGISSAVWTIITQLQEQKPPQV